MAGLNPAIRPAVTTMGVTTKRPYAIALAGEETPGSVAAGTRPSFGIARKKMQSVARPCTFIFEVARLCTFPGARRAWQAWRRTHFVARRIVVHVNNPLQEFWALFPGAPSLGLEQIWNEFKHTYTMAGSAVRPHVAGLRAGHPDPRTGATNDSSLADARDWVSGTSPDMVCKEFSQSGNSAMRRTRMKNSLLFADNVRALRRADEAKPRATGISACFPELTFFQGPDKIPDRRESSSSRLPHVSLAQFSVGVFMSRIFFAVALVLAASEGAAATPVSYDVIIRGGTVYDGTGGAPYVGDVAVTGDRIAAIAPHIAATGKTEIDARGLAVSPGFINMLAHPEESLIADGRGLSDLAQGVTLEVMGEDSMGPLTPEMKKLGEERESDIKYPITWTTLGGYLDMLQRRGISPNVASFVGAATVRTNLLGEADVQPTPAQLAAMQGLVKQAMEEGALGLTDALIYSPNTYAKTPELIALAKISARCGGEYIAHIRSEGDRLEEAVQESIDIAEASGAPAEIYHFKQAGRENWGKLASVIAMIEASRAKGVRISANMYNYTAGATGLDAAMPSWVQDGGLEKWIARLKDPATRARVKAEMLNAHPKTWENLYAGAGADGTLLLAFKNPKLKPLTGKTLAEVAKMRHESPEDTAIDLVIEDGSRVGVAYFLMSEDNVRREVALPWMSFDSDEAAPAPEGVFLLSNSHPRAYGNFARLLGHYVRETHDVTLQDAIRRLTGFPAQNLALKDRGILKAGYYADIVVFDPATIADKATYAKPAQLAVGVSDVLVNGGFAYRDGKATGAHTGRVVHGRAWVGAPGGGCRASASDWAWSK